MGAVAQKVRVKQKIENRRSTVCTSLKGCGYIHCRWVNRVRLNNKNGQELSDTFSGDSKKELPKFNSTSSLEDHPEVCFSMRVQSTYKVEHYDNRIYKQDLKLCMVEVQQLLERVPQHHVKISFELLVLNRVLTTFFFRTNTTQKEIFTWNIFTEYIKSIKAIINDLRLNKFLEPDLTSSTN